MKRADIHVGDILAWKNHWSNTSPVRVIDHQAYSGGGYCGKHPNQSHSYHICPGKPYTKVMRLQFDDKGELSDWGETCVSNFKLIGQWAPYHEKLKEQKIAAAAKAAEREKMRATVDAEQTRMAKVKNDMDLRITAGEFPGIHSVRVEQHACPPMPANGRDAVPGLYRVIVTEKVMHKLMGIAHA